MPVTAVVGLQWGDEAKGKIVDLLTDQHDVVVRYLGGNNAGHTVMFGGETYKLSLLPSGILRKGVTNVVATGVVINPQAFLGEMTALTDRGIEIGELLISDRAHVIFPPSHGRRSSARREPGRRCHRHHDARHRYLLP